MRKNNFSESTNQKATQKKETKLADPDRREAISKLVKYTPPAMITLLAKDSAWAQISGGPPPPPSDIRLKTDIHYLGEKYNGYKLYCFRYKDDKSKIYYVGAMAQEILNVNPQAVVTMADGYYAVKYNKLGFKMTTYDQWKSMGPASIQ